MRIGVQGDKDRGVAQKFYLGLALDPKYVEVFH
jgi:hypothetical protein